MQGMNNAACTWYILVQVHIRMLFILLSSPISRCSLWLVAKFICRSAGLYCG